jgi:hypothetical protein
LVVTRKKKNILVVPTFHTGEVVTCHWLHYSSFAEIIIRIPIKTLLIWSRVEEEKNYSTELLSPKEHVCQIHFRCRDGLTGPGFLVIYLPREAATAKAFLFKRNELSHDGCAQSV